MRTGKGQRPDGSGGPSAVREIIDEAVLLFHRLAAASAELHVQGDRSAGKAGVLRSLHQLGPQTVPRLARVRPVSRQHIQTLVNALLREGRVERVENPAHKRSQLVRLTTAGRALAAEMEGREAAVMPALARGFSAAELRRAAATLRRLRERLAAGDWRGRVGAGGHRG